MSLHRRNGIKIKVHFEEDFKELKTSPISVVGGTWYQTVNTEQVLWYQPTRVGGEYNVGRALLYGAMRWYWRGYTSLFEMNGWYGTLITKTKARINNNCGC